MKYERAICPKCGHNAVLLQTARGAVFAEHGNPDRNIYRCPMSELRPPWLGPYAPDGTDPWHGGPDVPIEEE